MIETWIKGRKARHASQPGLSQLPWEEGGRYIFGLNVKLFLFNYRYYSLCPWTRKSRCCFRNLTDDGSLASHHKEDFQMASTKLDWQYYHCAACCLTNKKNKECTCVLFIMLYNVNEIKQILINELNRTELGDAVSQKGIGSLDLQIVSVQAPPTAPSSPAECLRQGQNHSTYPISALTGVNKHTKMALCFPVGGVDAELQQEIHFRNATAVYEEKMASVPLSQGAHTDPNTLSVEQLRVHSYLMKCTVNTIVHKVTTCLFIHCCWYIVMLLNVGPCKWNL